MDQDLAGRFDRIERQLSRLDGIEKQLGRFDGIEKELRQIHVVVEDQRSTIEMVAEGVLSNDQKISLLRSEMKEQFQDLKAVLYPSIRALERRATGHDARIGSLEHRVTDLEGQ